MVEREAAAKQSADKASLTPVDFTREDLVWLGAKVLTDAQQRILLDAKALVGQQGSKKDRG